MSKIEYAAKTRFTEDRDANAQATIPADIRELRDSVNAVDAAMDEDAYLHVVEVSQRAGLPIPERRG
jgi:hypothetical protein